jgi:hypothetical protein
LTTTEQATADELQIRTSLEESERAEHEHDAGAE